MAVKELIEPEVIELLLQHKHFYGHLLQQFRRHSVDHKTNIGAGNVIRTLAVMVSNELQPHLFINNSFYNSGDYDKDNPTAHSWGLTQEEKIAVLEHEILHILNKHLLRTENRNHYVWNLANDLAINQYIKGLPYGGMCPECNIFVRKTPSGQFRTQCPVCGMKLSSKAHVFEPLDIKNFKIENTKINLEAEKASEIYYDILWSKIPKYVIEIGSKITDQQEKAAKDNMGEGQVDGNGNGDSQSQQGEGQAQGGGNQSKAGDGDGQDKGGGGSQTKDEKSLGNQEGDGNQGNKDQQKQGKGGSGDGSYQQKQDEGEGSGGDKQKDQQNKAESPRTGAGCGVEVNGTMIPMPMDNHEAWAAGSDNKEMAHEKIKEMVKKAVHKVNEKSQGYMPGWLKGLIDDCLEHKTITWKSELRRFYGFREFSHFVSTRKRMNRRFPVVFPGYKVKRKAHFVVATDSSGSVDDKEFAMFWKEIGGMFSAGVGITHVECDADITHVQPYKRKPPKGKGIKRYGYGGTDFTPVFKFVKKGVYKNNNGESFKLKQKVDGIIYCTDGAGTYPRSIPCPTIWVMTPEHYTGGWNPKLGKIIVMEND